MYLNGQYNKRDLVAYTIVYNDDEFLEYVIDSVAPYVDKYLLVEGSFQINININGVSPRSSDNTIPIIKKMCDKYKNCLYIPANCINETEQRQFGLVSCDFMSNAQWCMSVDADEIFPEGYFEALLSFMSKNKDKSLIKLTSYNFFNGLSHYYDGEYPRIYNLGHGPRMIFQNSAQFAKNGGETVFTDRRYLHYSYTRKNHTIFLEKMRWVDFESHNQVSLLDKGYGVKDGKYQIPVTDFKEFTDNHPDFILSHFKLSV